MTTFDRLYSVWFSHTADKYGYGNGHYRLKPELFDMPVQWRMGRQYARTIADNVWVLTASPSGPTAAHIGVSVPDTSTVWVLRTPYADAPAAPTCLAVMEVQDLDTLDALAALVPPHTWTVDMFVQQSVTQFLDTLKGAAR